MKIFVFKPIPMEMILQPQKISTKKVCWKLLVQIYSLGNDFETIKIVDHKNLWKISFKPIAMNFGENFWFKTIPEEMILQI
jgi:hypothetical protein